MRHTNAGAWTAATWVPGSDVTAPSAPYHTKVPLRQTLLKLFAADYCGGGNAYTMDGQPLLWSVTTPPYTPPGGVPALVIGSGGTISPAGGTIEALWSEKGALCLDTPRRPDLWDGACSIPACGGPPGMVGWQSIAHALSANGP